MKFKFNAVLSSFLVAFSIFAVTATKVYADGPVYKEIEPNNSAADANSIVPYDSVNGTLAKGDIDYYKIYIPDNNTYEFWMGGTNSVNTIKASIIDANNKSVFEGKIGVNGNVTFDGNLQGLYYVSISDDQNLSSTEQYNFEIYPKSFPNNPPVARFSGNDRYETSLNMFKNNWSSCNYAVITTGEDFADALSAAPLAKKYNAPIVLTKPNELSIDVVNQLKKTGVTKSYIIGGQGVVSKDIENKLISMGITCIRIFGNDRYSTSIEIAKYLNPKGEVVVTTGDNFPDALSIAPIAAYNEMPIILVNKDNISDEAVKYIKDNGVKNLYIIGGIGAISTKTEASLSQITTVKRLFGSNRYETNIDVLTYFNDRLKLHEIYYATGLNFPDALSGSVIAAAGNHPIVLVDKNPDLSTIKFAVKNKGLGIGIFGGQAVLPDSVISSLTK